MDLTIPTLNWIDETTLPDADGNSVPVHVGDKVDLVEKKPRSDLCLDTVKMNRDHLGEGPYTVSHIGQWRCGRHNIIVDGPRTQGSGMNKEDIYFVESSSEEN